MKAQNMIDFINRSLNTVNLKLSKSGEKSVQERWNKSEKNGGYTLSEREIVEI